MKIPPTDDDSSPGVRSLKNSLGIKRQWRCHGKRPWIGEDAANEHCERPLHGLMRGGSNVYFPITKSSILIPKYSWKIYQQIIDHQHIDLVRQLSGIHGVESENFKETLKKIIVDNYQRQYIDTKEYSRDDFKRAFLRICKDISKIPDIKKEEWDAFYDPPSPIKRGDEQEFQAERVPIKDNEFLQRYFNRVVVIKRLSEVIALRGFTRIHPQERDLNYSEDEVDGPAISNIRERDNRRWERIFNEMADGDGATKRGYQYLVKVDATTNERLIDMDRDWLPGTKNKGEGIFLVFDQERLSEWENDRIWLERTNEIVLNGIRTLNILEGFDLSPRGLLIHTFSHLLGKQIAKECGYQLSSLRERLYVSKEKEMYGVLIYTSTPDSQGSLGGLISQAEPPILEEHIRMVIGSAERCSQDPLCGLSNPSLTKKPWGASCHSCLHLPETSCESLMNRFLERHTISGDGIHLRGYFE